MHFHFPFTTASTLWTLTFAAHLVVLVVLIGRDRFARFPWFTASIGLIALRLLVVRLLMDRLPQITLASIVVVLLDVTALVTLMVVVEMARRAFGTARRASWLAGALSLMAVGALVLRYWGPWPPLKTLTSYPTLQLLEFLAQKLGLLSDVETVGIGLLIVALGYRCAGGWRTHVQRIVIGLSTASLAQIAVEAIWQAIARSAVVHGMTEYNRVIQLRDRIFNANNVVYIAVLIWWIVVLWNDEPGATVTAGGQTTGGEEAVIATDAPEEIMGSESSGHNALESGSEEIRPLHRDGRLCADRSFTSKLQAAAAERQLRVDLLAR
jgi:hypothetical protein